MELQAKLTTLAVMAWLHKESEQSVLTFFRKSAGCTREQAKAALEDANLLAVKIGLDQPQILTTAMVYSFVKTALLEKERRRTEEEQQWNDCSDSDERAQPNVVSHGGSHSQSVTGGRSRSSVDHKQWSDDSDNESSVPHHIQQRLRKAAAPPAARANTELAEAVKVLRPDELLVQARMDFECRDPVKEHTLRKHQFFAITQVKSLDDGSDDAWLCGYDVKDPSRIAKWIFSGYVDRVPFHNLGHAHA